MTRPPTLLAVLLMGGWTVRWRQFHGRRPVAAESIRGAAWIGFAVLYGLLIGSPLLFPAMAIPVLAVGFWWDYRPNGRGRRHLEANQTNPRRGFE
ncbi:MAG: hypothetical protein ACRENI_14940 [Gemmatimonadaceae bacterium]